MFGPQLCLVEVWPRLWFNKRRKELELGLTVLRNGLWEFVVKNKENSFHGTKHFETQKYLLNQYKK